MVTLHLDSTVSLTDQLVRGLRRAIAAAQVAPGDPLPSVRQMAADLGVNLNTVARAYRHLEEHGLVRTARGRGTQVTADREATAEAPTEVEQRLLDELRVVLTDAKLAGMGRENFTALMTKEVETLWPRKESAP